ncbi:uncharacterized protein SAPINGB_P002809 [Magnusiomyces paraingens]|uniref:Dolichyl-phosphate-mannose--protein mannosyltransferase n=1 Tax=Magnusiomyces paraingens TaxID=2606893 RepID=A0A5E8BM43_9ASCO|nr:uncharacterized protein SAPINGB_P002809 [Saprochaete ingens]VVT50575.1 unnamed protein product [Saprochaete ingens]
MSSSTYTGHNFPFIELRSLVALLGIVSIILSYLTIKLTGASRISCILCATFVTVETSFVLQHRYIFTAPLALTFFSLSIYLWKKLELKQPLSLGWHATAAELGLVLGCCISTQPHSLFTLKWIWFASVYQLWWSFGDKTQKTFIRRLFLNILFRVVYLALVPYIIYNTTIAAHLRLTPFSGEGDSLISGPFQYSLIGNPSSEVVGPVGIGSFVSIRHLKTHVYLHSHDEYFPQGSFQQQVTGYGYRDSNNYWVFENVTDAEALSLPPSKHPFSSLKNDTYVRIRHLQTSRRLHTHKKRSPITDSEWQFEVSGYGAEGYPGDLNDIWKVEIVDHLSKNNESKQEVNAINSIVRFKHLILGCYLFTHPRKLPEYAHDQQEITCALLQGKPELTYWYIETNYHPNHLPNTKKVKYETPPFSDKMEEYKEVMEKARISVLDETTGYTFPAWKLPFLTNGIPIFRSHHRQTFLIGNIFIWYMSLIGLIFYIIFRIYTLLAVQGGWKNFAPLPDVKEYDHHAGGFFVLWAFHYLPLFLESRALTSVDYLPSLYCTILLFGKSWDFFTKIYVHKKIISKFFTFILISSSVIVFIFFSPFTYHKPILSDRCHQLELLKTWDFGCFYHFETYAQYNAYDRDHYAEIYYQSLPPPKEELEPPSVAGSVHRANPTEALTKRIKYTKSEINAALEKYKNLTSLDTEERKQQLYEEGQKRLVQSVVERIKKAQMKLHNITEEEWEERNNMGEKYVQENTIGTPTEEINPKHVSRIQAQWLRITNPPSVNFTGKSYEDMKDLEQELNKASTKIDGNKTSCDNNNPKEAIE